MKRFVQLTFVACLALASLAASFPYVTLNNKTNRLSDNGSALTFNGSAIGGGSAPVGTVVASGTNAAGMAPRAADNTGTNVVWINPLTTNAPAIAAGSPAVFVSSNVLGAATSAQLSNTIGSSVFMPIGGGTMTGLLSAPSAGISSLLIGSMSIGTRTTVTEAAGIATFDLSQTNRYWSLSPTGDVAIVIAGASAGNWGNVMIRWPATNCNFSFRYVPSGSVTNWLGGAPSTGTAGTLGWLSFYPIDSTTNSTLSSYVGTQ